LLRSSENPWRSNDIAATGAPGSRWNNLQDSNAPWHIWTNSLMEMRLLKVFCSVAECGSLVAAAGKLHLTPSAISHGLKALETELDSMQSLLEVLHQNSLSLRDPQAISDELDTIVRQSEASERAVREFEAMLRAGGGEWAPDLEDIAPPAPQPGQATPASRQKAKGR